MVYCEKGVEGKRRKEKTSPDQSRPDQTGPDQNRTDQTRPDQSKEKRRKGSVKKRRETGIHRVSNSSGSRVVVSKRESVTR